MTPRLYTALFLYLSAGIVLAATSEEQKQAEPTVETQGFTLTPTTHIYTPYLADQKRVTFAFQTIYVTHEKIPQSGYSRFGLRLGGRLELFKYEWRPVETQYAKQLQANLEVGFRGYYDNNYAQDEIGSDGNYGLLFSYRGDRDLAYRFGVYHTSSHIGDEYLIRTGRDRIGYTREELLGGIQYNLNPKWQVYAEIGYAYRLKDKPLQQKNRAQAGLQFQETGLAISERLGWYAAFDLSSYQERNWHINKSFQIGYSFDAFPHTWRLAFEYYNGQVPLGEFFKFDEEFISLGLYLDL